MSSELQERVRHFFVVDAWPDNPARIVGLSRAWASLTTWWARYAAYQGLLQAENRSSVFPAVIGLVDRCVTRCTGADLDHEKKLKKSGNERFLRQDGRKEQLVGALVEDGDATVWAKVGAWLQRIQKPERFLHLGKLWARVQPGASLAHLRRHYQTIFLHDTHATRSVVGWVHAALQPQGARLLAPRKLESGALNPQGYEGKGRVRLCCDVQVAEHKVFPTEPIFSALELSDSITARFDPVGRAVVTLRTATDAEERAAVEELDLREEDEEALLVETLDSRPYTPRVEQAVPGLPELVAALSLLLDLAVGSKVRPWLEPKPADRLPGPPSVWPRVAAALEHRARPVSARRSAALLPAVLRADAARALGGAAPATLAGPLGALPPDAPEDAWVEAWVRLLCNYYRWYFVAMLDRALSAHPPPQVDGWIALRGWLEGGSREGFVQRRGPWAGPQQKRDYRLDLVGDRDDRDVVRRFWGVAPNPLAFGAWVAREWPWGSALLELLAITGGIGSTTAQGEFRPQGVVAMFHAHAGGAVSLPAFEDRVRTAGRWMGSVADIEDAILPGQRSVAAKNLSKIPRPVPWDPERGWQQTEQGAWRRELGWLSQALGGAP